MLCQKTTRKETIILKPAATSIEKLISTIRQRWEDKEYQVILERLQDASAEDIKTNAKYHKTCYSLCNNKLQIQRLEKNFKDKQNNPDLNVNNNKNEAANPGPSKLTRTQYSTTYSKTQCIFCDGEATRFQPLHAVTTSQAGAKLLAAVSASNNNILQVKLQTLRDAIKGNKFNNILHTHEEFITDLKQSDILIKMENFNDKMELRKPNFKVILQYIKMVENMLQFLRAVRTSNWELHIAALKDFSKYFFAMGQINYARMIPWYIH